MLCGLTNRKGGELMPTKEEALKALKDIIQLNLVQDCDCNGCAETRKNVNTLKSYLEGDRCPEQKES